MEKLELAPDDDGYTVTPSSEVILTVVEGGPSRVRRDLLGSSTKVTCTWTVGEEDYQYLRAFYLASLSGASKFRLDLIVDTPEPVERVVRFLSGSMKLRSQSAFTYVVTAELEVYSE